MGFEMNRLRPVLVLGLTLGLLGCDAVQGVFRKEEPRFVTEQEAAAYFAAHPAVESVTARGNVVEIRARQDADHLRRGGSLWAKVGPYIYLLSPSTRDLLEEHPGVAAVRVVTIDASGEEIARALLRRDALSDILWRRTHNLLGHALQQGTTQPTRLEDLVRWGEQHTEYEYSPKYVPR